jgi:hypothetical protein
LIRHSFFFQSKIELLYNNADLMTGLNFLRELFEHLYFASLLLPLYSSVFLNSHFSKYEKNKNNENQ